MSRRVCARWTPNARKVSLRAGSGSSVPGTTSLELAIRPRSSHAAGTTGKGYRDHAESASSARGPPTLGTAARGAASAARRVCSGASPALSPRATARRRPPARSCCTLGMDQRLRQPQPIHRLRVAVLRDLGDSTTSCSSASAPRTSPTCPSWPPTMPETSPDGKVWTFKITDKSSGRTASRSPPRTSPSPTTTSSTTSWAMFIDYMQFIDKVEARRRHHGRVHLQQAQGQHARASGSPSCPSTSGARSRRKTAENKLQEPAADHRLRALPDRRVQEGRLQIVRMVANKDYWRGAPRSTRSSSRRYQNQDTMAQDLKTGAIRRAWNIPSAQFARPQDRARSGGDRTSPSDVRPARLQLRRRRPKSLGNPVLQDPAFRQRAAVGRRQGQDRLNRLRRQRRARRHRRRPGELLGASTTTTPAERPEPTRSTSTRRRRPSTRPATPTPTATASASTRARPSSCASGRAVESAESQNCGKLITGWFEEHRPQHRLPGHRRRRPRRQAVQLRRGRRTSPPTSTCSSGAGAATSTPTSSSVSSPRADPSRAGATAYWSNAEYDKLFLEQQTTIDVQTGAFDIVPRRDVV